MFCSKCGQKNDENSIFCHNCGEKILSIENSNIKIETEIRSKRYTMEEYLKNIKIKTKKEAGFYLTSIRILFWGMFLSLAILRGLGEDYPEAAVLYFIFHIVFLIFFITYCVKLLRLENLSSWNVIFAVLFAPISWLYFYPLIADPLKIILEKKQLPIIPSSISEKEKKDNNRKYWKKMIIFFGVFILIFIFAIIYIISLN